MKEIEKQLDEILYSLAFEFLEEKTYKLARKKFSDYLKSIKEMEDFNVVIDNTNNTQVQLIKMNFM